MTRVVRRTSCPTPGLHRCAAPTRRRITHHSRRRGGLVIATVPAALGVLRRGAAGSTQARWRQRRAEKLTSPSGARTKLVTQTIFPGFPGPRLEEGPDNPNQMAVTPTRAQLSSVKIPVTLVARSRTAGNRTPAPQATIASNAPMIDRIRRVRRVDSGRPTKARVRLRAGSRARPPRAR
jgi:hypothetical protein